MSIPSFPSAGARPPAILPVSSSGAWQPLIVGIGGTTRAHSGTERALSLALRAAEEGGARTQLFGGQFLADLPHYAASGEALSRSQLQLVEAVRDASAVIVASPGYHGGISGLVKNALDTLEALRDDARPYLDGRAVACIVTAYGAQAGGTVLASLRTTVHALRGWPTPYGVSINALESPLDKETLDPRLHTQLGLLAEQVLAFSKAFGPRAELADRSELELRHG